MSKLKTNKEVKPFLVESIKIGLMQVKIKGESPLLMNRFSPKSIKEMLSPQIEKGKTKSKEVRKIKEEIQDCIYRTHDGKIGIPVYAFKKALISASSYMEGLNSKDVKGSIFIIGDIVPLKFSKMVVNESIVKIGKFHNIPFVKYRPSFLNWSCDLLVKYNSTQISPAQILNLFRLAGFHIGVLDWRPQKSGSFGQFDISDKHFIKTNGG